MKKKTKKRTDPKRKIAALKGQITKLKHEQALLTALPENYNLHRKKLEILERVPIIPCSAISRDKQGLRFAHTQATEVFNTYREECQKEKLVVKLVELKIEPAEYEDYDEAVEGQRSYRKVPCCYAVGRWRITDKESGESEEFCGAGYGDNFVWSANSAQTIAFKQALLMYFFTAWPQPTDWTKIIRESIQAMKPDDQIKAIGQIVPEYLLEATGVLDEMRKFFGNKLVKKGKKNARVSSKRKSRAEHTDTNP